MAALARILHLDLLEGDLVGGEAMAVLAFERLTILRQAQRHPRRAAARVHVDIVRELEARAFERLAVQRSAHGLGSAEAGVIGRAELRVLLAEIMRIGERSIGEPCVQRVVAIGAEGL